MTLQAEAPPPTPPLAASRPPGVAGQPAGTDLPDFRRHLEGFLAGWLASVLLCSGFGGILAARHGSQFAAAATLLRRHGLSPVVDPAEPLLHGVPHLLGSGLFLGLPLGTLTALTAWAALTVPWARGRWLKRDTLLALLLLAVNFSLTLSREALVCTFAWSALAPLAFFLPWRLAVQRPRRTRRSLPRLFLFAAILSPVFVLLAPTRPGTVRDLLLDLPGGRVVTGFYYEHTLLAAHVIKPVSQQTQPVVALAPEVPLPESAPAESLWVRRADPCGLAGRSVTLSAHPLRCPSMVLTAPVEAKNGGLVLRRASVRFDHNRALRGVSRWFLRLLLPASCGLVLLWGVFFLEDLFQTDRGVAALLLVALLSLLAPAFIRAGFLHQARRAPEQARLWVSDPDPDRRYAGLRAAAGLLTDAELETLARDQRASVRLRALAVLGGRQDPASLTCLAVGLQDPVAIVRAKACRALGNLGRKETLPLLERVEATDPSWYVRNQACHARSRIAPAYRVIDE